MTREGGSLEMTRLLVMTRGGLARNDKGGGSLGMTRGSLGMTRGSFGMTRKDLYSITISSKAAKALKSSAES